MESDLGGLDMESGLCLLRQMGPLVGGSICLKGWSDTKEVRLK